MAKLLGRRVSHARSKESIIAAINEEGLVGERTMSGNKKKMLNSMNLSHFDAIIPIFYYIFRGGHAPNMNSFTYEITYRCNLKCKMCYLWGEKSEESTQKNILHNVHNELNINELQNILIPQLKRMHVKAVKITGGEPLIRKDIFEVIKLFRSENFKCRMISNLSIQPEKNAKKLVESGLEGINVSIDGPKEVHDKIRGVIGAYSKTTDTLKAITKLKNEKPIIRLNCVISAMNMAYLSDVMDTAKKTGADVVSYQFMAWSTNEVTEKTNHILELTENRIHFADIDPPLLDIDSLIISKQIEQICIKSRMYDIPVYFHPLYLPIKKQEIEDWYSDACFHRVSKCLYPFMEARMDPYGNIYPCLDVSMGNIKNQGLKEIWNNERYVNFRKKLKTEGIFPACSKCCMLGVPELKYLFSIH